MHILICILPSTLLCPLERMNLFESCTNTYNGQKLLRPDTSIGTTDLVGLAATIFIIGRLEKFHSSPTGVYTTTGNSHQDANQSL
jgi:hypothetical protein